MSDIDKSNDNYLNKFQETSSDASQEKIKHTILIVDDEEDNLQLLQRTLRREYNVLTASGGVEALEIVEKVGKNISLILSDQRMPDLNGVDFLTKTFEKYPHIIKILVTGYTDIEALIDGVNNCQLFQYVSKPFDLDDIKQVVSSGINAYELTLSKESLLQDLRELFFTTIKSISSALDAKDTYTHGHSFRVTLFSLIIAREINLEHNFIEQIEMAGLLHDIGKIGVPESILCKPGKLTDDEYNLIKLHPEHGKRILSGIRRLQNVSSWTNSHHERWDGRGYPQGLKEKDIPLPARILAIADTYDAMTSNRSYRQGLAHEIAVEEIKRCSGAQFDPELVEAFLKIEHIIKDAAIDPVLYYSKYSVLNQIFLNE